MSFQTIFMKFVYLLNSKRLLQRRDLFFVQKKNVIKIDIDKKGSKVICTGKEAVWRICTRIVLKIAFDSCQVFGINELSNSNPLKIYYCFF